MIVWRITGNEIGPGGNGARYFAKKEDAAKALREYRAERGKDAGGGPVKARSMTASSLSLRCTMQWATGLPHSLHPTTCNHKPARGATRMIRKQLSSL
jgi:hypothetical protein